MVALCLPAALVRTLVSFSPHVWVEGSGEVVRAEAGGADAPAGVKAVTAIITDTLHTMLVILHGDHPPPNYHSCGASVLTTGV